MQTFVLSFELKQPGQIKSHVPSDEKLSCYSDAVLEKLSVLLYLRS